MSDYWFVVTLHLFRRPHAKPYLVLYNEVLDNEQSNTRVRIAVSSNMLKNAMSCIQLFYRVTAAFVSATIYQAISV